MESRDFTAIARGVAGMAAGAVAGYFVFSLLIRQGLYAPVLPAALMGWGCAGASRIRSPLLAWICGLTAAILLILFEWHFLPFAANGSLSYFLKNVHKLPSMKLLFIALGIACAAYFALGNHHGFRSPNQQS